MQKIIGATTTYNGTEHPSLKGVKVRIVAVLQDDAEGGRLYDDESIRGAGGLRAADRVEVQPWLKDGGRFSFVTSDPRAIDLDCFTHLVG